MKKNIFIILISIIFILILFYFYDKREIVLNKEYKDLENHIYIEYPYFDQINIDTYIYHYLNSYIDGKNFWEDFLFIDYDYLENGDDQITLNMYVYKQQGSIVKEVDQKFKLDLSKDQISYQSLITNVGLDYDIYQQKFIDPDKKMVALTFDDGPNHNTVKILDILQQYDIKATFFILGCNIQGNEKILSRMKGLGMELGNHMYSHKLLTKLSNKKIQEEVRKVDDLVFNIIGTKPTLIRPSYGSYNKRVRSVLERPIIIWNIDTLDWKYHNSKRIYQRVMKNISDGDIILMHDIYSATANSLKLIIPELLERGFQFVTVSELLYYKGIEIEAGKVYSNAN